MFKNDPVYKCNVYKEDGCAHVDGLLCDFPECDINNDFDTPLSKAIRKARGGDAPSQGRYFA